jgi:hypothetical protein
MNKYEKLFSDIVEKTDSGEIEWRQISKSSHADLIFNPDMAFRQYSANYKKGSETYEVIFVEKKTDDPNFDFAFQKYMPEVLVIDKNNDLIVTLTDSVIEKNHMIDLVKNIEKKNDKTKKLFD